MRPGRMLGVVAAATLLLAVPCTPVSGATWPAGSYRVAVSVQRVSGPDRYATAVAVARAAWPAWTGVKHVVVASGEDRAIPDSVAAGSLCWAYDAPLLLVRARSVPAAVRAALQEMVQTNGPVRVTVVGGTASVGPAALSELKAIVGAANVEQPWTGGDRYTTAAGVAARSLAVAAETSRTVPARALVANGTSDGGLADALALSAVSARTGVPILFVRRDGVPGATGAQLAAMKPGDVVVAGGTRSVSTTVFAAVGGAERWAGEDRHGTAAAVARGARSRAWLTSDEVGIAARVPDALTGAVYAGRAGAPVLLSASAGLSREAAEYLAGHQGTITHATVFGDTASVSVEVAAELSGAPSAPRITTVAKGPYVAKKARIVVATGVNTSEVQLYANDALVASRPAVGYSSVDFGVMPTPTGGVTYRVVATNPDGGRKEWSGAYKRLTYPASTSIVIDKSEFRLYFVKGDVLIRSYKVGLGRPSMETPVGLWKVGVKYHSNPAGAFGPRKMRLYRKSGSSWVFTHYLIHGTNEPWAVGIKASHGCMRLYNRDVLDLYPLVPVGTLVQTRQ